MSLLSRFSRTGDRVPVEDTPGRSARRGILGTLLIIGVIASTLTYDRWPLLRNENILHVQFAEAGGLNGGDDVVVSGASIGRVSEIDLVGDHVEVTVKLKDDDVRLGRETRAAIVTVTLLGRAAVRLEPQGTGRLQPGDTIPVARTSSPYDVTSALSQLTGEVSGIDKAGLTKALGEVTSTFRDTPDSLGPALTGIRDLSASLAANDRSLQQLLDRARQVTGVLAGRDRQVARLLTSGQQLLAELDARQGVVVELLASARALAHQLTAVVEENDEVLPVALDQVNRVIDLLNANKRNLEQTITGLRNYATAFGEAISSGPFFDAYIQNLTAPASLAPVLSGALP